MKKNRLLLFSLLILWVSYCSPASANPPQTGTNAVSSSFFDQGRIGIGLALEYLNLDLDLKIQPTIFSLNPIASKQSQTGKHFQVAPCIELGRTFANDYYLGLLLSWRYSGLKSNAQGPIILSRSFDHEFKLNNYADLLVKGGYKFLPCMMVYGLAGPTVVNWSHRSLMVLFGQVQGSSFEINKTSLGLGLGFGLEYLFKKNYAFSIDYTYHLQRPTIKSQLITITTGGSRSYTGDVIKKVDLSFSTIALRFTVFL